MKTKMGKPKWCLLSGFKFGIIKELIETFSKKGYKHGASYFEKLADRLFTNIELWLKTGVIAPKTTSLLERVFREFGR